MSSIGRLGVVRFWEEDKKTIWEMRDRFRHFTTVA
jgi:hypothetical protein